MTDNQPTLPTTVAQPQSIHPIQGGKKTYAGKRQSMLPSHGVEESSDSESSSSSALSGSQSESEEEEEEEKEEKKGERQQKKGKGRGTGKGKQQRLCSLCKESYDHMKNNCPSATCSTCQGTGHTATGKCPQKQKRLIHCGICGEIGHNLGSSKYHTNAERNEFKGKLTKKLQASKQEAGEINQQIQHLQEQQDDTKDELIKELKKQLKEKNLQIIKLHKQLARHEEQIQDLEDSRQRMMRCFERSEIRTKAREDKLKEEIVKLQSEEFQKSQFMSFMGLFGYNCTERSSGQNEKKDSDEDDEDDEGRKRMRLIH